MIDSKVPHRLYVDLDTILDTRLAIIKKVNKNHAIRLAGMRKYHERISDNFTLLLRDFNIDAYIKAWDSRGAEDIVGCYPTFINGLIHTAAAEMIKDMSSQPYREGVEVTINTYPYVFDEAGKDILRGVGEVNFLATTRVVYIPTHLQDPKYFGRNFDYVYMYEFDKWLTHHFEDLKRSPIMYTSFHVPLLLSINKTPDIKRYDINKDKEFMENTFKAHMGLSYLPANFYCMHVNAVDEK